MTTNIKITNPDKIIFPKSKITKLELLKYYLEISSQMLPFLENRILSVIRCHDNINGECFFKKHPTTDKNMVEIFKDKKEEYFFISKTAQLVYQVQMGTVEFHPWASKVQNINKPDTMIFDLDPDEKLPLEKLRENVLKVKSVLDELSLESFLKTSGGKGYHIVVPFKTSKNWKKFYDFSKQVALLCESKWPNDFTTNIKKDQRKGKIFVDYLRNNRASTCVCAYSVRARENAPISFPISWKDINEIKPNEITIKNYKTFKNKSWKNFFETNQSLN